MSAVGAGAVLLPMGTATAATPKAKSSKDSNIVRMGFIGLGQQAMGLLNGFIGFSNVEVVAGCDVYQIKNQRFTQRVEKYYAEQGKKVKVDTYEDYQDLLAREDIDAVVIATPDHQHAIIGIAACKAKKDIYVEKPMTFTLREGRALCDAVRDNCRISQVGSQQRSDPEFIHAVKMIHERRLGKLRKVLVWVGDGPKPYDLPKQQVPEGLNWDKWLGPLPETIHYNEELNPSISLDPEKNESGWGGWRWYKETGGGYTTDWGAHMFDIAQWALSEDYSCPVRIVPPGCEGNDYLTFTYDTGLELVHRPIKDKGYLGVKFIGEKGTISVCRGSYECSDPAWAMPEIERDETRYEERKPHLAAFINAVISRIPASVPVGIGHSSNSMCILGNIAYDLGRPLEWNPVIEKFDNDPEADSKLHYQYRPGYTL